MDIREVILNKKHSLEMDELKTAHALAIGEWEQEVRDHKDYNQQIDQELDEVQGALDELETTIHSKAFRTAAFYAMVHLCRGECLKSATPKNYTFDDCVFNFASTIDIHTTYFEFEENKKAMAIVEMICKVNDWDMIDMLVKIQQFDKTQFDGKLVDDFSIKF